MLGQWPAGRLAPSKRLHGDRLRRGCHLHLCRCLILRLILLQLEQLQLELVEQGSTLRLLAEPLVPQLGDGVLQLLNQQRADLDLAVGCNQSLALRQDQRMGGFQVGRQGGRLIEAHASIKPQLPARCAGQAVHESIGRDYPAVCGRMVRCGRRQSIPSSR
jgi:hypothetical protein